MRIAEIEIYRFNVPLKEPFHISIGTVSGANDVLVRIRTDSGIVGLGEACPFPPLTGETQETNLAAAAALRDLSLGKDPLATESLVRLFAPFTRSNPSMAAAFDMALHDIRAKAASLPLFRLLGGDVPTVETDVTVGLDEPETMARRAKELAAQGFRTLKVKVGQGPRADAQRLQAIRKAVGGGCTIRVDANQGWTVPLAIEALRGLEEFGIEFVEQPVAAWDLDGLKRVREASPIPVMADESVFSPNDAMRLAKAQACDYLNIKLMKSGGILSALRIADIGESAGLPCMIGCMLETRLALTAAAHVMAARPNIRFADLDGHTFHTIDPIVGGMRLEGGRIELPETPGLGVDVDPAFLKGLERV